VDQHDAGDSGGLGDKAGPTKDAERRDKVSTRTTPTTNTTHPPFAMVRRKKPGASRRPAQGGRSGPRPSSLPSWAQGAQVLPVPPLVVAGEVEEEGTCSLSVAAPATATDPAGLRVLGWRFSVRSSADEVKLVVAAGFHPQHTYYLEAASRAAGVEVNVGGSPGESFALEVTRWVLWSRE